MPSSSMKLFAALLVACLAQTSMAAIVVCKMDAQDGDTLTAACSVGVSGQPISLVGPGSGQQQLTGSQVSYTLDVNARSTLFECASEDDLLIIDSSQYSSQTLNNCEPPLLELRGCSNAILSNNTFISITRSTAQPGCTISKYGPCVAVVGAASQETDWSFSSLANTFTSTICSSISATSGRLGGAFAFEHNDSPGAMSAVVKGSTFTSTACDFGGAIHSANASLTLTDSTFTGTLAVDGGAVQFVGTNATVAPIQKLQVKSSTFTSNTAVTTGGIIQVTGGAVSIDGSTFTNGEAQIGQCVWLDKCESYTENQITGNTWTGCAKPESPPISWCKAHDGNNWTTCGMEGPRECY
uniref:Ice-binding protein 2 n=3 Tax=unclassified Chloromonas TaxID=2060747 RepID=A0A6M2YG63_9CHLO|nr:ice-binding protein [Chloromonas sp. 'King Sejong Station']QDO15121.1 ice-binding protein 2 [Chloromonas sp. KNF032]QEF75573.1 ice binding protein-2 [Chloromonas sp. KNF0032]